MNKRIYLNDDWLFTENFTEEFLKAEGISRDYVWVSLPHTVKETPFNSFDESIYAKVSGYKKRITFPLDYKNKSGRLTFEGVAHKATVYINGEERAVHACGYTGFTVDITKDIKPAESIEIMVKVDSNETLNQPPFGFVVDYMTYGGIYRDVYLDVGEPEYIDDLFLSSTKKAGSYVLKSSLRIHNPNRKALKVVQTVNNVVHEEILKRGISETDSTIEFSYEVSNVTNWDIEKPSLYDVNTKIFDEQGVLLDERTDKHGFREAVFKKDGFYLNGRKVRIRGLNRHQSYPYVGYAMPASMQRFDADIMKNELGLNAVRTSHYPQSHDFINRCDELGLLVFMEIPGWQFIGDGEWKNQAVKNTEEMVSQYRNHPSIILWGVRINESPDDDELYKRTNEAAHKLDPTRPTGGVRNFKKSHFFEDVYTYNDFCHDGEYKGCEKKKLVATDNNKPYLITEYGGHMYPCKAYDYDGHRTEHMKRHATVINAVAGEKDIAGSFGWCLFDYNTHKEFGSGDRICYHGVLDMFRNPKLAAYVYAADGLSPKTTPVLEVSSSMDIGEHPESKKGIIYILSNADSVKMYKNNRFVKEYFPKDSSFANLKHGPILINDYIGDAIITGEKYSNKVSKDLSKIANHVAMKGLTHMSLGIKLLVLKCMLFNHVSYNDAVNIYNKYVGDWGNVSPVYRFDAIVDGKVVKSVTKTPNRKTSLAVNVSHTELVHSKSYDVALVRIKAIDENGNLLSYFNEPLKLRTEGPIEIVGPSIVSLKGGMAGVYVKTKGLLAGEVNPARLDIANCQCGEETVEFKVKRIKE